MNHKEVKELLKNITAVVSDDRRLKEGCLFICCPITNHNGAESISKAIRAGAAVVVTEKDCMKRLLRHPA